MDSYNENKYPNTDESILMSFHFDEDLAGMSQEVTYSDTPPEDDESVGGEEG